MNVYALPAPFIHTKAILVDDNYSLIGSANMDPRSLRLNFELGVEVFSQQFAAQIAEYFEKNLAEAHHVCLLYTSGPCYGKSRYKSHKTGAYGSLAGL